MPPNKPCNTRTRSMPGWIVLLAVLGANLSPARGAAPREARLWFSDGEVREGMLSPGGRDEVKLHTGAELRKIPFAQIRALRQSPRKEEMARKWRHTTAGQTAKEMTGAAYPVVHLEAEVATGDGVRYRGHLLTTLFYLEAADGTVDKILFKSKLRGQPGQAPADLAYVTRIAFADAPPPTEGARLLRIAEADVDADWQVAALPRPALDRIEASPAKDGDWRFPETIPAELFLGARRGERILVGWPAARPKEKTIRQIESALAEAEEFFEEKRLLAAWQPPEEDILYTLLLLVRRGKTAVRGEKTLPWRVGVWRWRGDGSGGMLVSLRGVLFRGLRAKGDPLPDLTLRPALAEIRLEEKRLIAGETP